MRLYARDMRIYFGGGDDWGELGEVTDVQFDRMKEAGKSAPSLHANCRCTVTYTGDPFCRYLLTMAVWYALEYTS